MRWIRYLKPIGIVLLLAGLASLLRFGPRPGVFESVVYGITGGAAKVQRNTLLPYGPNVELKKDIQRLRRENTRLRMQVVELKEALERHRFEERRRKAGLRAAVTAQVVGRLPQTWDRELVVDRGSAHGVRKGYVALGPEGLAGRVMRVTRGKAVVRLIIDPGEATNCRAPRSNVMCVAIGNGSDTLRIKYVSRHKDVRRGDVIQTSGLGLHYPAGVAIGRLSRVSRGSRFLMAEVAARTAVDFDSLKFLYLVPAK